MSGFRFCVLGSGSDGNSTAFWDSETMFLVDAGFSRRETMRRMDAAGLDPGKLDAILVSHEHTDHIGGIRVMQKRLSPEVLATPPVSQWLDVKYGITSEPLLVPGRTRKLGEFLITPFEVPHDAVQTVGFIIRQGGAKVVVATDLGYVSPETAARFSDANAIILESNHDVEMLRAGPYPAFLKRRILGQQGHLSNMQSAETLAAVIGERTGHITLAHISRKNNLPEKALARAKASLSGAIGRSVEVVPASQFAIGKIVKV